MNDIEVLFLHRKLIDDIECQWIHFFNHGYAQAVCKYEHYEMGIVRLYLN